MCGRYTLRTPHTKLLQHFDLASLAPIEPRYNICPTQQVLVFRATPAGREMASMRWGFLPAWAADPKNALINARGETAATKPTFRSAIRQRRCLIPADGFYEWRKVDRRKEPNYIQLSDGGLFAFAGLWEAWQGADTCAILTTQPNSLVAPIHNRMPVILDPADYDLWLDPQATADALTALLRPFPSERMQCQVLDPIDASNAVLRSTGGVS